MNFRDYHDSLKGAYHALQALHAERPRDLHPAWDEAEHTRRMQLALAALDDALWCVGYAAQEEGKASAA